MGGAPITHLEALRVWCDVCDFAVATRALVAVQGSHTHNDAHVHASGTQGAATSHTTPQAPHRQTTHTLARLAMQATHPPLWATPGIGTAPCAGCCGWSMPAPAMTCGGPGVPTCIMGGRIPPMAPPWLGTLMTEPVVTADVALMTDVCDCCGTSRPGPAGARPPEPTGDRDPCRTPPLPCGCARTGERCSTRRCGEVPPARPAERRWRDAIAATQDCRAQARARRRGELVPQGADTGSAACTCHHTSHAQSTRPWRTEPSCRAAPYVRTNRDACQLSDPVNAASRSARCACVYTATHQLSAARSDVPTASHSPTARTATSWATRDESAMRSVASWHEQRFAPGN